MARIATLPVERKVLPMYFPLPPSPIAVEREAPAPVSIGMFSSTHSDAKLAASAAPFA